MENFSPLITLGLDPEKSEIVTLGYSSSIEIEIVPVYSDSPIVTWGFDPDISKIITLGYSPSIEVAPTIVYPGDDVSPIVTWGFDAIESKIVTLGYGSEYIIQIEELPTVYIPGRGPTSRKKEEKEDFRLVRIRVIDEDGKTMIQERLIPLREIDKIQIKVKENFTIQGRDIYINIKNGLVKDGGSKKIKIRASRTKE